MMYDEVYKTYRENSQCVIKFFASNFTKFLLDIINLDLHSIILFIKIADSIHSLIAVYAFIHPLFFDLIHSCIELLSFIRCIHQCTCSFITWFSISFIC